MGAGGPRRIGSRPEEVEAETASVAGTGLCVSDDEHVIALARASGARLLCSEDQLCTPTSATAS